MLGYKSLKINQIYGRVVDRKLGREMEMLERQNRLSNKKKNKKD